MIRAEFDGERALSDLQLTVKELETVRDRGLRDSLGRLRTLARKEVGEASSLKSTSITRRVRSYPRRGRLWIGAGRPYPLVTSFRDVQIRPSRRRRRGEQGDIPRVVVDRGTVLEGVFIKRINGVDLPFRQQRIGGRPVRSVEAVRREYGPEAERAFRSVIRQAPAVIDRNFRGAAERVIRARN